jgi:hypothetical protein
LLAAFLLQAILLLLLRTSRKRKNERKEGRKEGTLPPTPQSKLRISSLHDAGKATQSLNTSFLKKSKFPAIFRVSWLYP